MNFDKIYNQTQIKVTLTVEKTLLIGSGEGDISPTGIDIPQLRLTQLDNGIPVEVPYIPGSSLKGGIRSTCETMIRTYLGNNSGIICYEDAPVEEGCCGNDGGTLCLMCDTFGDVNRMSKVCFDDAFLIDTTNLLETIQHRTGIKISRKTGTVAGRALYKLEFIPKGARFKFNILCTNILSSELKLLLLTMRLYNDGRFKLGGQKSRGMGAISFDVDKITIFLPKLYRYSPFIKTNNSYTWSSELPDDMGNCIILTVPKDKWNEVKGIKNKIIELAKCLYPVEESSTEGPGTITVKIRKEENIEEDVIGVFKLNLTGEVSGVSESDNGLEYIIEKESLRTLFDKVYQSAFDFLGDIVSEVKQDEPYRYLGKAGIITIPFGGITNFTIKQGEGEKLHTLLVWLDLTKMILEG